MRQLNWRNVLYISARFQVPLRSGEEGGGALPSMHIEFVPFFWGDMQAKQYEGIENLL